MEGARRQCKAFEGDCQCEAPATTDPSLRDLCNTHEEKFKYLKDLYHNKHSEYENLEPNKKLYFNKYSEYEIFQAMTEKEQIRSIN